MFSGVSHGLSQQKWRIGGQLASKSVVSLLSKRLMMIDDLWIQAIFCGNFIMFSWTYLDLFVSICFNSDFKLQNCTNSPMDGAWIPLMFSSESDWLVAMVQPTNIYAD